MNIGALVVLSPPAGGDARDVRAMFDAALARNRVAPLWRRRPRRSLVSLGQWCWQTDVNLDLEYHVQRSALPAPAGMAELWDLVSVLHTGPLDPAYPLWQFHLIEGLADGRYAVYVKIHRALADGDAAMRLLQQVLGADPRQRGMPAVWEAGEPGRAPPAGGGDVVDTTWKALEVAGDLAGIPHAVAGAAWRAVRRRGGPLTLAAPHTRLDGPVGSARSITGCAFPIERLQAVAKNTDATVNEIVLAMCAGALRRYLLAREALPDAPLMAMVPVSFCGDDDPADTAAPVVGAKIGTSTCSLATNLDDPAERLAALQASVRDGKAAFAGRSQLQMLAMSAFGAAPLALAMMLGGSPGPLRPPNVLISTVCGPPHPLYWNGARLEALYPLSFPGDGQKLNITCAHVDDQISFGLTGYRNTVPEIATFADFFGYELDLLEGFYRLSGTRVDRYRDGRSRRRTSPAPRPG